MKLKQLKRGENFTAGGIEWTVLDNTFSGVSVVASNILYNMMFDEGGQTNFLQADLGKFLNGEFLEKMKGTFGEENIFSQLIRPTFMGSQGETKVALMSGSDYFNFRNFLPPVERRWWILEEEKITTGSIICGPSSFSVWAIDERGRMSTESPTQRCGVRPKLRLHWSTEI